MSGDGAGAGAGDDFEWNREDETNTSTEPVGEPVEPLGDDGRDATAELPRPPTDWRDGGDPTGSTTWRWLTRATLLSALLLTFWSVPLVLFDLVNRSGWESAATGMALGAVGLLVVAVGLRVVVLPVLLFRDASKIRRAEEVDWQPSRTFYMLTGAVFATLACGYYLFKRQRYVGNPRLLPNPEVVYYDGRRVGSNWHQVIGLAVALSMGVGGVGALLTVLEAVSLDLATAFFGPLVLLIGLAILCRFVLLPVAFYRDAAAVSEADVDWNPNGVLYATVGYVFALPAVALYLYRRHDRTGDLFPT